jgi:hypothetical protein
MLDLHWLAVTGNFCRCQQKLDLAILIRSLEMGIAAIVNKMPLCDSIFAQLPY